jgi:hypothetical protein
MRHTLRIISSFLCAVAGIGGCGKGDGGSGTKLTAQRVKVDAASAFADVLGAGPTTMPDGKTVSFDSYLVGQISLPSGQIVAADAFIMFGVKPFADPSSRAPIR